MIGLILTGGETVKRIVSVSLGASERNHKVTAEIMGETVEIERIAWTEIYPGLFPQEPMVKLMSSVLGH